MVAALLYLCSKVCNPLHSHMEFNGYKGPNFESLSENSSETKKDDKDKDKDKAKGLGKFLARQEAAANKPKQPEKSGEKPEPSGLEKLLGKTAEHGSEKSPEPDVESPDTEKFEQAPDDAVEIDDSVPLEELSQSEESEIAQVYTKQRAAELSAPRAESDESETAAEDIADKAYLESLQQILDQGEENVERAADAALLATAAELGVDKQAITEAIDELSSEDDGEQTDEEQPESEPADGQSEIPDGTEPEQPQEFDPDEPVSFNSSSSASSSAGSGGSGSIPPPIPPVPPVPSGAPTPGGPAGGRAFGGGGFGTGAAAGAASAANRLTGAQAAAHERRGMGRGLLVGGIVGYLIGRRRGRIKTERRMGAVQKKLEKQVVEIQRTIQQKEQIIRKLARETAVESKPSKPTFVRVPEAAIAASVSERLSTRPSNETPPEKRKSFESMPDRDKDPVDGLSKEQLLAFSSQIKVGETNLRRVYEAQMIDEKGLRRLIREYQAGHDLRRALAREFMAKEMKFERDPTLRDLLPPEMQPKEQGESTRSRNPDNDLQTAAAVGSSMAMPSSSAQDVAPAYANEPAATKLDQASQPVLPAGKQKSVSPMLVVGLALLTIGLAVYALWLTITR